MAGAAAWLTAMTLLGGDALHVRLQQHAKHPGCMGYAWWRL
jgi:hypothetical protein